MAYDLKTRQVAHADRGCAHRRPRLQPGGPVALGPADQQRVRRCSCACRIPYTDMESVHVFPFGEVAIRPRHLRRRHKRCRLVRGAGRRAPGMQTMQLRVMRTQAAAGRATRPLCIARARQRGARRVRVLRDGRYLTAAPITPACRTSIATSSRRRSSRRSAMPRSAISGRCRSTSAAADLSLHRRGIRACDDPAAADRGPERH